MKSTSDTLRQAANIAALLLTLIMNGLANALPLNGQTTGDISDRYPVYFVPAGYVFSIWGLIYFGLIAFGVYQALPAQRNNPNLQRIGWWFVLSCLANSIWIVLWHYEFFGLTLLAMGLLLASLIMIYRKLDIGRAQVSQAERWCVHLPFSIYLGWVTVATIANVTTVLYQQNWSGWGLSGAAWAVILLLIATTITAVMSLTRADIAYNLVIIWAFVGIVVKQAQTPLVATAAGVTAVVVALLLVVSVLRRRKHGPGLRIRTT